MGGIGNWGSCSGRRTIRLGRGGYHEIEPRNASPSCPNSKLRWQLVWMKLMKEKRKIFESCYPTTPQIPYDEYTYTQNFDQGPAVDEPDILSRSFSVRFADPSRDDINLRKKRVVY